MDFFNSLPIRITLALVGGIFYGLLTQTISLVLGSPSELALITALVVFFFYLVSRFLLLSSGVHTLYYSKARKTRSPELFENTSFYKTAQWVGKFYHYHDIALFIFFAVLSIAFLISLLIGWVESEPFGDTIQNILGTFIRLP